MVARTWRPSSLSIWFCDSALAQAAISRSNELTELGAGPGRCPLPSPMGSERVSLDTCARSQLTTSMQLLYTIRLLPIARPTEGLREQ